MSHLGCTGKTPRVCNTKLDCNEADNSNTLANPWGLQQPVYAILPAMSFNKTFLQNLLSAPGPSSFETRPAAVWREQAKTYGAKLETDPYGSSFAIFNKDAAPKIMLAGHIDEIGLIVTYIDKEGLIYFRGVGGWDSQQLVGQRARLLGYKGDIVGVIGKKPIHLMNADDQKKISKIEDLWIDIGAKNDSEAKQHVRVGDAAVLEQPYLELLNNRVASKAIDNRIGAYIVLEAARRAHEAKAKAEIVAVATTQEEIGNVGAGTAAYELNPNVAIAVDVTHATDVPNVNKKEVGDVPFGSGANLAIGSTIHRGVFNMLIETAEAEKIPYTIEANPMRTYTDADQIVKVRSGIPTAVVSIPNRYMHSPNEMIDLGDLEHVIALIAAFIGRLDKKTKFVQP
jgi:putative aminopeptidase FrvX